MSNTAPKPAKYVELVTDSFGFIINKTGEHIQVKRFTWKNSNRIQVQVITYGATITSIKYPNKKGIIEDVVLGFEELQSYIELQHHNFGMTIGRNANIIKNSSFNLMKKDYTLTNNKGKHHYNGGKKGFNQVVWNHTISGNKVILSHLSVDGDEGFPGDLLVFAIFELTNQNEFRIEYKAMSSKATIVNIVNHTYFNLAGHNTGEGEIARHTVMLNADCHTIIGDDMIPTGEIQSVLNTIYDLQSPTKLGPLFEKTEGFNNNFCVNRGVEQGLNFIARLYHASSGRILEVYSNQYGVQFDTANNLPLKCEADDIPQKIVKNSYLRNTVVTFDMLDEIYNKINEIKAIDSLNDYDGILNLLQDMIKKHGGIYRQTSPLTNCAIKRSSLTIENLPVLQLTAVQLKFVERIQKAFETVKESSFLLPLKIILDEVIRNNKIFEESQTSSDKSNRKQDDTKLIRGKKGAKYYRHAAVSFQCQNYPDAINNPKFPSPVLKPGSTYNHIVVYKFWIKTDQSGVTGIL